MDTITTKTITIKTIMFKTNCIYIYYFFENVVLNSFIYIFLHGFLEGNISNYKEWRLLVKDYISKVLYSYNNKEEHSIV